MGFGTGHGLSPPVLPRCPACVRCGTARDVPCDWRGTARGSLPEPCPVRGQFEGRCPNVAGAAGPTPGVPSGPPNMASRGRRRAPSWRALGSGGPAGAEPLRGAPEGGSGSAGTPRESWGAGPAGASRSPTRGPARLCPHAEARPGGSRPLSPSAAATSQVLALGTQR